MPRIAAPLPQRTLRVVGAAIVQDARCLVARRGPGQRLAGRFEFPGGKIEPGERAEAALARELDEELGIEAEVGERLARSETLEGGRRLRLDVHAVRWTRGALHPREHAELRWVSAAVLDALDWAPADVPALPAVRAHLGHDPAAQQLRSDVVFATADWGLAPRKRAVWVARPAARPGARPQEDWVARPAARPGAQPKSGWTLRREEPPARGWSLAELVLLGERLRDETGRAVVIGIDAVLGVPVWVARAARCAGFLDYLERLAAAGGLEKECADARDWHVLRPFFRVPAGRGALFGFVQAAGGRSGLLRQVELRAGAKSVFVLSGIPGSVGSGTRELWRELALLRMRGGRVPRVWPFDGPLAALALPGAVVLAEMYPRAAYAAALAAELPARPCALAKTQRPVRVAALRRLVRAPWLRRHDVVVGDLDAARASEDDFDALMTAAALVRFCAERRALAEGLVDPDAEGGILGC